MARIRTKRLGLMARSEIMAAAEAASSSRYPVESKRISEGSAVLLGLFAYKPPCWVIEICNMDPPHYICLRQEKGGRIYANQIVGLDALDWSLWLGGKSPSEVNSGDSPSTYQTYHNLATRAHENPQD